MTNDAAPASTSALTPERMWDLHLQHGTDEYAGNIDALMAGISAEPLWEIHPLGLRIENRDSIRIMYGWQMEHILHMFHSPVHRSWGYGNGCFLRESTFKVHMPDGSEGSGGSVSVYEFEENGLLRSERGYATGVLIKLVDMYFPADMWDLPGATRMF